MNMGETFSRQELKVERTFSLSIYERFITVKGTGLQYRRTTMLFVVGQYSWCILYQTVKKFSFFFVLASSTGKEAPVSTKHTNLPGRQSINPRCYMLTEKCFTKVLFDVMQGFPSWLSVVRPS